VNTITLDEIASSLKLNKVYVRDKVVKRPDFPRPAIFLSQKTRRWMLEDVQAWIGNQRDKMAR
jgi:predicted DNA-binding transcriptional regulator AlpA